MRPFTLTNLSMTCCPIIIRSFFFIGLPTIVFASGGCGPTDKNTDKNIEKKKPLSALTNGEKKILKYLKQDWRKTYRTTNIGQAMSALGMPFDDQKRRNIGEFLKQAEKDEQFVKENGRLHWGWVTFTLTNNEKLLGRYIIFKESKGESMPSIREIRQKLGIPNKEIEQGLEMLRDIGFLLKDVSSQIGYRLSSNASQLAEPTAATFSADRNLGFTDWGSLGFTSHTVRVNNGPEFNVQCFLDYLILSRGGRCDEHYKNELVSLRDTCLHCVEPITITYDKGKMVKLEPKTALHVGARGCGSSNVFFSMEHYREWKKQHPGYRVCGVLETVLIKEGRD